MWGSEQPKTQTSVEKKLKKIIQYKNHKKEFKIMKRIKRQKKHIQFNEIM